MRYFSRLRCRKSKKTETLAQPEPQLTQQTQEEEEQQQQQEEGNHSTADQGVLRSIYTPGSYNGSAISRVHGETGSDVVSDWESDSLLTELDTLYFTDEEPQQRGTARDRVFLELSGSDAVEAVIRRPVVDTHAIQNSDSFTVDTHLEHIITVPIDAPTLMISPVDANAKASSKQPNRLIIPGESSTDASTDVDDDEAPSNHAFCRDQEEGFEFSLDKSRAATDPVRQSSSVSVKCEEGSIHPRETNGNPKENDSLLGHESRLGSFRRHRSSTSIVENYDPKAIQQMLENDYLEEEEEELTSFDKFLDRLDKPLLLCHAACEDAVLGGKEEKET